MNTTMTRGLGLALALTLIPAIGWSQERVGVATTVLGPVMVTRVSASPAPLKFKDDVLLNDRIHTGERGFARMLLGGRAVVTAREHSVVVINEVPGVSTIELLSGRLSVAVDKSKMLPGEIVEIKTPNAVAGIRGTIVIAEALNSTSTITVLRGLVDVYRRDPVTGNPVGPATPVSVRESVTVRANVLPARPQTISVDGARRLSNDFTPPAVRPAPTSAAQVADELARAQLLLAPAGTTNDITPALGNNGNGLGNGNANGKAAGALTPTVSTTTVATTSTTPTTQATAPTPVLTPILTAPILPGNSGFHRNKDK